MRLRTEPLTDELVVQVSDDARLPLLSIARPFWRLVATNPGEWRARLMADFERNEQSLTAFVADEDSGDTLRWIVGILKSFAGLTLSVPSELANELDEAAFASLKSDGNFNAYLRALITLMAAAEAAKQGGDPGRARNLLDVAFLELVKFRSALRKQGVSVTPFPYETIEERRRRLLEGSDRLRKALSPDDWRVLEQARVSDLR